MSGIFNWIKKHRFLTVIFVLVFWFILSQGRRIMPGITRSSGIYGSPGISYEGSTGLTESYVAPSLPTASYDRGYKNVAPTPDVTDRKVSLNSNFSLLVKNVNDSVDKIKQKTDELSGYMVNMNVESDEYGESANMQLRVPSEKLEEMSIYLRGVAVKVVSENTDGKDVTDQYVDVERRLADLEKQRVRIERILDMATTATEMMNIQNELFLVQDQIDALKGSLLYMDGITKTSKITIYLSSDELSLPYTPSNSWRPEVVFKLAVRAMFGALQVLGTIVIWLLVFAPLIALVVITFKFIKRFFRKKTIN